MRIARTCLVAATGAGLVLGSAGAVGARDARDYRLHSRHHHEERWQHDIRRFDDSDRDRWRSGHWYHGRHHHTHRLGWWWIVGGIWYSYPAPVYPYPDPYQPAVIVTTPPAQTVSPAPQYYWYYCSDPAGYYPYVPECRSGWQPVPATPAGVPAPR